MTTNKCEDSSLCENFQAAICLHCDHRLCIQHIIEHDKIVFGDVNKLLKLTEETLQQIKTKSEKSRIAFDDLSLALDEWRTQELEKIEQIYQHELEVNETREEVLERFHRCLFEELERDARRPLERVQKQQNSNKVILNSIQATAEKLRKESTKLKWEFPTLSSVNAKYSPSEFSLIPTMDMTYNTKEQNVSSSTLNPNPSCKSTLSSDSKVVKLSKGRLRGKLVAMFSNTSSIQQSKDDIASYKGGKSVRALVNSYLTAWNRQPSLAGKNLILNEHISTIQKYLGNCTSKFDVLVGIQVFFFNQVIKENKYEMMVFLLQFFLAHQCLNHDLILRWYYDNDAHGYMGFEEAKRLVEPFITLLSASDKVAPLDDN